MGMFFNSWKDDEENDYGNYSRGYDDGYVAGKKYKCNSFYNEGYEDAKKEFKKSFDSAYNKGFRAGLNLYMEKKEPLKKDALEILIDELKLNESLRSIELETIDVQDSSEHEIRSELYYGNPESVQYDECEVDSEPDNIISAVSLIDSPL